MSCNSKNEQIKRRYEAYLRHSKGLAEASLKVARRALATYDRFSNHADYKQFNEQKAIAFKEYLEQQKLAKTTHANCLKQMKQFFEWLSLQAGYKSRITRVAVDYLNLSRKEKQLLKTGGSVHMPSLADVKSLVESIPPNTEVNLRDRALISFLCLTGMRDSAVATLPLKSFDTNSLMVDQDPANGVKTKFTKHIWSKMFRFDNDLVQNVLSWVELLRRKGFTGGDPLFPRSKVYKEAGNLSFQEAVEVEAEFWTDGTNVQRIIKKRSEEGNLEYFHPHTYRHLAIQLAFQKAKCGADIKAISQNFGHEEVATTLSVYGNYQVSELIARLQEIDAYEEIKPKEETLSEEKIQQMLQEALPSVLAKMLQKGL